MCDASKTRTDLTTFGGLSTVFKQLLSKNRNRATLRSNRISGRTQTNMTQRRNTKTSEPSLRAIPEPGTRIAAAKNQGYQIPLPLWQDLVEEASRRKQLGLPFASQNAIAVAGISAWLEKHKGVNS